MNKLHDGINYESDEGDVLPIPNPGSEDVTYSYPEVSDKFMVRAIDAVNNLDPGTDEAEEKSPRERQMELRERFGFYGLSKREISSAIDLTGQDFVGGAATRLNIILQRQKNYVTEEKPDMPEKTVRAVVNEWAGYAEHASTQAAFIKMLETALQTDTDDKLPARDALALREWRYDPATVRALAQVEQFNAIKKFVAGMAENPFELGEKEDSKPLEARLKEVIDALTIGKLKQQLSFAARYQEKRLDFWTSRLQEARNHTLARGIANVALTKLRPEKIDVTSSAV